MKMEQTECSETSAYKIQTPGNCPEESIQHSEQGENLKSRIDITDWVRLRLKQNACDWVRLRLKQNACDWVRLRLKQNACDWVRLRLKQNACQ